ncbi:hypothetical protein [Burkholderia gladioli]|uniref:hypothetical protein n=1 Tax=Burkholderia gladioli TaxID=28095 RepID=UPI00163DF059|nr:hypothetical protein [Burkholderia gladioli]
MSRQRTLNDAAFWRSPEMAGRTQEDRAMLCYLLTSPFSNIIGAYQIVPRIAASEMGWDSDSQLLPVIHRLSNAGFLQFDPESSFVWVRIWWNHNSAKMAVGGTLRQRTFEQIAQIPQQWRRPYVEDFVGRLPLHAEDKLGLREAVAARFATELGDAERVPVPYSYPMDRGAGNSTTNGICNTNTTTTEGLRFPISFPSLEVRAMRNALAGIPVDDAQQLIDEVVGATLSNSIKTTPTQFLNGLIAYYRTGAFKPSAGVIVSARRCVAEGGESPKSDPEIARVQLAGIRELLPKN